jgi:hypothetical protein
MSHRCRRRPRRSQYCPTCCYMARTPFAKHGNEPLQHCTRRECVRTNGPYRTAKKHSLVRVAGSRNVRIGINRTKYVSDHEVVPLRGLYI